MESVKATDDFCPGMVAIVPETLAIPPPPRNSTVINSELPIHINSEEHLDVDELLEFAEYLGLEPGQDNDLLWLAEQALCAPLPEGWREAEDHLGNVFYMRSTPEGEVEAAWEHPHDGFYRRLVHDLKGRRWDLATHREVVEMARYLGLDPSKHAELMWLPHQAVVAPLPSGWQELEDEHGTYFWSPGAQITSRAHPLDAVFRTAARVEKARLENGRPSLARSFAIGEEKPSLRTRLAEDDGSSAYTYDWIEGRRVPDERGLGSQAPQGKGSSSAAGAPRTAEGGLEPGAAGPREPPEPSAQAAAQEGVHSAAESGSDTASNLLARRVSLVSRQSGISRSALARDGGKGSRTRPVQKSACKRRATRLPLRPFEHYPAGLPASRQPRGWQVLNPVAVWVWILYCAWAWGLVLPGVRRVLPRPPER